MSCVSALNSQLVTGTEGSRDDDVCSDVITDNSRVSVVSGDSCTSAVKCDPVLCRGDELIVDVENVDVSVSHLCMADLTCHCDDLPSAEKTGFSVQ